MLVLNVPPPPPVVPVPIQIVILPDAVLMYVPVPAIILATYPPVTLSANTA